MSDVWSDRLSEYVDGEISDAERFAVEGHLRQCDDCRQSVAELRRVVERLAADSITPGDQPGTRQWHAIRHALPSRRHRRWAVPVAIAASLTGLIVAGALVRPRRVADTDAAAAPAAYVQASADLEAVLLSTGGASAPKRLQRSTLNSRSSTAPSPKPRARSPPTRPMTT
jgi:anti-sigma factor RsiW